MTGLPTPESICLSLGLDGFEADMSRRAPARELRLLLCPTFDPEICLTFLPAGRETEVRAISARDRIGSGAGEEMVETDAAEGRVATPLLELGEAFRQALSGELDGTARDGAVLHVAWRDELTRLKLERANPAPDAPLGLFAARLIQLALDALPAGDCRARIARAGRYVGIRPPSDG